MAAEGPGGPCCTVVVENSWVGRGAPGLHEGGLAGAGAGSFQWQHRGAGDQLIKVLTDGLGYGTHVCAWPHDAHQSQLAVQERDTDLAQGSIVLTGLLGGKGGTLRRVLVLDGGYRGHPGPGKVGTS